MDISRSSGDLDEGRGFNEKTELPKASESQISPPTPTRDEPLSRSKSAQSNAITRIASRITTRSIRDPGPPPDGGVVAWTQIACAWLAVMNSW
jgi:hypothetical protein